MSDEDEFLQKARSGFEDLCRALNMDEEASSEAWKSYENISRNFTLEVKHLTACYIEFVMLSLPLPIPLSVRFRVNSVAIYLAMLTSNVSVITLLQNRNNNTSVGL